MNLLFIDANIFLRLFDSRQPEYKKLLNTLVEIKKDIFVTDQIVNEVNRNKLSVFRLSCSNSVGGDLIKDHRLPEHFDSAGDKTIKSWNTRREDLGKISDKMKQEQSTIYDKLLSDISFSKDVVSQELHKIFSKAKPHTKEQMERAIERKQIGNPPGKPQDPLGDQLSWEQLLDNVSETTNIWIISNDSDYFSIYHDRCYLNPVLSSEVFVNAKKIESVKCFDKLSNGLKDYNDHLSTKLTSLPKEEELGTISQWESLPILTGYGTSGSVSVPGYSGVQNIPWITEEEPHCPSCQTIPTNSPYILVAGTDAMKFIYVCHKCGRQWEDIRRSQ